MWAQLAAIGAQKLGGSGGSSGGGGGGGMPGFDNSSSATSSSGGTNTGPVVNIGARSAMGEAVPWLVGGAVVIALAIMARKRKG